MDVAMDECYITGRAVYCCQMCGVGPHLIHTLSHIRYKGKNDQVRTLWKLKEVYRKAVEDKIEGQGAGVEGVNLESCVGECG